MTRGASLTFDQVSKSYGAVMALQPTSMSVAPGEFFALLGPSGSGKSTLLGTIAGFVAPSGGRVLVDGTDITGMSPHRRNIGMVFQNYALFPYLTVAQNIAFPLKMRRLPKSEISPACGSGAGDGAAGRVWAAHAGATVRGTATTRRAGARGGL